MVEWDISNQDIESTEKLLLPEGAHFPDDARNVIRCWRSADVAACPGSGKTYRRLFQTLDESKNFFEKSSVKCKMRPSARRRQTQRKHKKYLDDVIVHLYARNTPLQGIDFF